MRIIIELTEEESRSTQVIREAGGGRSQERSESAEVPTSNGGPPPNELLTSLGAGAMIGGGLTGAPGDGGPRAIETGDVTSGGEPSGWLSLALGKMEE